MSSVIDLGPVRFRGAEEGTRKPCGPPGVPSEAPDKLIVVSAPDFPDGQGALIVRSLEKPGGCSLGVRSPGPERS